MSWLSKQVKSAGKVFKHPVKWAENAGRTLGKGAKIAAPFLPPGFRQAASYGGSLAAGDNMKEQLQSVVGAELGSFMGGRSTGQAIGKGIGALKTGGLKALPRVLGGGGGVPEVTRNGVPANVGDLITGGGPASLGDAPSAMSRTMGAAGGWLDKLKANPMDSASGALAGIQGIQSAMSSARAGKYQKKGLDFAEGNWNERAPLRAKSLDALMNPPKVNLSSTYGDASNPFSLQAKPRPFSPRGVPL